MPVYIPTFNASQNRIDKELHKTGQLKDKIAGQ